MNASEAKRGYEGIARTIQGRVRRGALFVPAAAILAASAGTASGQTPTLAGDTIVILPDTQYYSDYDIATFKAQTRWIASQDPARVKMVIHVGDVTHDNTKSQWERAEEAMDILRSAGLPFVMVPGNHDNPDFGARRDTGLYNRHFPPSEFASQTGMVWTSLDGTSDNSYALFRAGGRDFMVVNLEFAPRKQTLCLANQAITSHPNRAVILATHCYQTVDGGFANCTRPYNLIGSNGDTIWHELARRHHNVQMIVSGHITSSAVTRRNLVSNAQALVDGQVPAGEVLEILTDFQMVPNNFPFNHPGAKHGMGWMRSLSFVGATQNADEVELNTFSVLDPVDALDQLESYRENEEGHFPHGHHPSKRFFIPATFPAFDPGELVTVHDFTVNDRSTGNQLRPRIAGNQLGDYTIVWEDSPNDSLLLQSFDIKSRRFGVDGCERRLQETINGVTAGQQRNPAVAIGQDGSKVVVWEDDNDGNGSYQILASAWESNGTPRFLDMVVNQVATGQQLRPDVAVDRQGNLIVVWQDNKDGDYDIMAARFNPLGVRIGPNDFRVNAGTAGNQLAPRLAVRRDQFSPQDGSFVIVWHDDFNTNDVFQIKAARYSAAAVKQSWPGQGGATDRTINQFASGQQIEPAIAMHNNSGQFVIVWQDDRNVNDLFQIKMAGFNADGSKKAWGPVVQGVREEDQTVNQGPGGDQRRPQISMNNDGHFAVVWEDDLNDNKIFQIKVAGFRVADGTRISDASGGPMADATVNANSNGQQLRPDVLLSENGQVIVAWQDDLNDNGFGEIVAKSFMLGQPVDPPGDPDPETEVSPAPPYAQMDGAPWLASQGSIDVELGEKTAGAASIAFAPGFTEARPPSFRTGEWPDIGSKLLVDVFVPTQQPASSYKGAVQLYWEVPAAGYNHQFAGQKELSALVGGRWHTLEFDLPDVMRRLFLEPHKNAGLAFAVTTEPGAPARTLLDNLRFGGALIPHAQSECDTSACLAVCGPGKASCDGNVSNGCETYLGTSRDHCGACGHSCGGGVCVSGVCEAPGARRISATLTFTSQWSTGYCAEVTFTNHALAAVAWEVVLDLKSSTITSSWNGTFSGSAGLVGVSGAGGNSLIPPGASLQSLGFCAQRPANGSMAAVLETNTQFE